MVKIVCRKLKACIARSYAPQVTHIVMASNTAKRQDGRQCVLGKRTMKYMQGVINGKWIVSFDWIEQCIKQSVISSSMLFILEYSHTKK